MKNCYRVHFTITNRVNYCSSAKPALIAVLEFKLTAFFVQAGQLCARSLLEQLCAGMVVPCLLSAICSDPLITKSGKNSYNFWTMFHF